MPTAPVVPLAVVLALLAAAPASPVRAADAARPAPAIPREVLDKEWLRLETPRFVMFAETSPREARRVADRLERLSEVLLLTSPALRSETTKPACVFLIRSRTALDAYRPRLDGKPQDLSGFFHGGRATDYLTVQASDKGTTDFVALHEYVHLVLHSALPEIPLWLNEGMAEYYATIRDSRIRATAGAPVEWHMPALGALNEFPLARLFNVTHRSPEYNEASRSGLFYAYAWATVHALLGTTREDRERFEHMLVQIRGGSSVREALKAAWPDMDDAAIESRRARHFAGGSIPGIEWTFDRPFERDEASITPARTADLLFHLGDLLAHMNDRRDDAAAHFRAALAADPRHAPAMAGLADLEEELGHHAEASRLLTEAEDSGDALALLMAGQTRWRRAVARLNRARARDSLVRAEAERLREVGRSVLAVDPMSPDALAFMGKATVLDGTGDLRAARSAVRRAGSVLPYRSDLLYDEALLDARLGDYEAARTAAVRLAARGETEMAQDARDQLAAAVLDSARSLWRLGETQRADSMLRAVRDWGGYSPGVRGHFERAVIELANARMDDSGAPGSAAGRSGRAGGTGSAGGSGATGESGPAPGTPVAPAAQPIDPERLAQAQRLVRNGEALAGKRDYAGAGRSFDAAAKALPGSDVARRAARRAAEMRFEAGIDEAVALARSGRYAEAEKRFAELERKAPSAEHRERAQFLRQQMRRLY